MAQSVAEFLALGGKIQTVAEGTSTRTNSELYAMCKDDDRSTIAKVDKQFGGTLSDTQLLAHAERNDIEEGR